MNSSATSGDVCREDGRSSEALIISSIVLALLICTAILGNIAVIIAIHRYHKLREQVANALIANLSVTDLCSAGVVMTSSLVTIALDVDSVTPWWCAVTCATNYCLIIVSMMTLACISVDRYIAISHPLRYVDMVTRRRVYVAIGAAWLQGMAFALPPVVLGWSHYNYWEAVCAIDWHNEKALGYVIVACLLCFAAPAAVIVSCNVAIMRKICPSEKNFIGKTCHRSKKTIASLLAVVVCFFLFMTPFSLTKLLKVFASSPCHIPGYVNLTAAFLAYLSSLVNPFIYAIFRIEFRHAYRVMLQRTCICHHSSAISCAAEQKPSKVSLSYISKPGMIVVQAQLPAVDESGELKT